MAKQQEAKWYFYIFFILVSLSLLSPLLTFKSYFFPYVTSKAFYFRILVELALPFYVYFLVSDKNLRPNLKNSLTLSVLGFLFVNLISAVFGVNFYRSFWGTFERMGGVYYIGHLVLLYFYILLLAQKGGVYIKRFMQIFLGIAGVVALNGLFAKLGLPKLADDPSLPERVSSTFGNPIFLASFIILCLAFSLFFYLQEEQRNKKIYYGALSVLFLIVIYFTGTRGAAVGLIGGAVFGVLTYVFLSKNKKFKVWGLSFLGAVFALGVLLVVFNAKLPQNSVLQRLGNLNDSNAKARLLQWKSALQGFKDYPVLGVGAENYYVISNKYYDTELAKYDASWFDKPHNYILEILATNGILGFLSYASMVVLSFWAAFKAYKQELITVGEFAVLVFGIASYQIQNLFVFDTANASIAFFTFTAFLGFLYLETKQEKVDNSQQTKNSLAFPSLVGAALIAFYLVYVTNVLQIREGKNLNTALAFSKKEDYAESKKYFDQALAQNISFDLPALFSRYGDMALAASQSQAEVSPEFVGQVLKEGIELGERTVRHEPNNPINWYHLAALTYFESTFRNSTEVPLRATEALAEALKLAPTRREMWYLDIKLKQGRGMWQEALEASQKYHELYPQFAQSSWEVGWSYYKLENFEEALKYGQQALDRGFVLTTLTEHMLFIDYYEKKGDLNKVVEYYEKAAEATPENINVYLGLVKAYAKVNRVTEARSLAAQIVEADPSRKGEMEAVVGPL